MIWKTATRSFPQPTGLVKTITSITLRLIEEESRTAADPDKLGLNFQLCFNGYTLNADYTPAVDIPITQQLHSNHLVRQAKAAIIEGGQTDEALAEAAARSVIYPLLTALVFGTIEQAFGAASALATQYGYELLPLEHQFTDLPEI